MEDRYNRIYREGFRAGTKGLGLASCPYVGEDARVWELGYDDAFDSLLY